MADLQSFYTNILKVYLCKSFVGGTIQSKMEAELSGQLGYEKHEHNDSANARNGVKPKTLRSRYGEIPISIIRPQ